MKNIAVIMTAGKQTRFTSNVPKALYPSYDTSIYGLEQCKTILENTISSVHSYVDKIYIITSFVNYHYFKKYNDIDKLEILKINSGVGCGDSVFKALKYIDEENCNIILMWGDSIHFKITINNLIITYNDIMQRCDYDIVIPVVYEENPYVQFTPAHTDSAIVDVKFKKYGDKITPGYHDLSIFMFQKEIVLNILSTLYRQNLSLNGLDFCTRNGEFIFLDCIPLLNTKLLDLTEKSEAFSFNTIDEYFQIMMRLDREGLLIE